MLPPPLLPSLGGVTTRESMLQTGGAVVVVVAGAVVEVVLPGNVVEVVVVVPEAVFALSVFEMPVEATPEVTDATWK